MSRQIFSAPGAAAAPATPARAPDRAPPDPARRPMLHAATRIETPDGARAVETLGPGDRVTVMGGEAAPVREVRKVVLPRADWAYRPGVWPLRLPVGVVGNLGPLRVSPGMRMLLPGETEIFAAVADLVGIGGVARDRPMADIRYYEVVLPDHALIRVEGAHCETAPEGPRTARPQADRAEARRVFATMTGRPMGADL